MRVALFVTCFNDTMFPESAQATVRLLERLGVDVDFPAGQTCCGQMHINTGYRTEAVPLVRRYVESFEGYDAVVAPSASCAGTVAHHHATIAAERGDAAPRDRAPRAPPPAHARAHPPTAASAPGAPRRSARAAARGARHRRPRAVPARGGGEGGRGGRPPAPGHLPPDVPLPAG